MEIHFVWVCVTLNPLSARWRSTLSVWVCVTLNPLSARWISISFVWVCVILNPLSARERKEICPALCQGTGSEGIIKQLCRLSLAKAESTFLKSCHQRSFKRYHNQHKWSYTHCAWHNIQWMSIKGLMAALTVYRWWQFNCHSEMD